jgi:hypothetical protein
MRFSVSSVESWSIVDGTYQLEKLWSYIVRLFDPEDGMHPGWIQGTIDWWREYVCRSFRVLVHPNTPFSQTPGLRTFVSVQDLDGNSDDDEDNDVTTLRRQARGWADGGTHSEEADDIHAISWCATAQNDNDRSNPAARSRSLVGQTHAETPFVMPSVRHAQSQPQGSQVTRPRTRSPYIAQAVVQTPPVVFPSSQISRVVQPRPSTNHQSRWPTQVPNQTPLTSPSRVQIPRVVQPSSLRSRRSNITQSPRGSSPAPASKRIADAQDAQAPSPISNMPLPRAQEPLQPSQRAGSQVCTIHILSVHSNSTAGEWCSPCCYRQEKGPFSYRPGEQRGIW